MVVIEEDATRARQIADELGSIVVANDGCEGRYQAEAGMGRADVMAAVTGDDAGPCIRCAVHSWDATGRERWRDLQNHLIGRHDNKFGVIMRVTKPGTVRVGDPVAVR